MSFDAVFSCNPYTPEANVPPHHRLVLTVRHWSGFKSLVRSGSAALCSYPSICSKLPTVRPPTLGLVRSFLYHSSPSAAASSNHLRILDALLPPTSSVRSLGERSEDLRTSITLCVMQRGFYPLLAKALGDIVRFDHPTRITL
jgi:hypothetical protein